MNFVATFSSALVVILLSIIATVNCADDGKVDTFTLTPGQRVLPGSQVEFRCHAVRLPGATTNPTVFVARDIHLDISSNQHEQHYLSQLNADPETQADYERYALSASEIGGDVNVSIIIKNVKVEDSGNYTCYVDSKTIHNNSKTLVLEVIAAPQNVTLSVNDRPVSSGQKYYVKDGQRYKLNCFVDGGNPNANVTLMSGITPLGPVKFVNLTNVRKQSLMEPLIRNVSATVESWTARLQHAGRLITCNASVDGLAPVVTSFMPIINHTSPQFDCADTVYVPKEEAQLRIDCAVYSTHDMKEIYVKWATETKNMTIDGRLDQGKSERQHPNDGRYKLIIDSPRGQHKYWWNITLTADEPSDLGLSEHDTLFEFFAKNNYAPTQHLVAKHEVKVTIHKPDGGEDLAVRTVDSSAVWMLLVLPISMLLLRA